MSIQSVAVSVRGLFGLWPFAAVPACGRSGLWPFWFVVVSVCGRSCLWPFLFVAVSVCGRFGLWPFRFWPFRCVAVMTRTLCYNCILLFQYKVHIYLAIKSTKAKRTIQLVWPSLEWCIVSPVILVEHWWSSLDQTGKADCYLAALNICTHGSNNTFVGKY